MEYIIYELLLYKLDNFLLSVKFYVQNNARLILLSTLYFDSCIKIF